MSVEFIRTSASTGLYGKPYNLVVSHELRKLVKLTSRSSVDQSGHVDETLEKSFDEWRFDDAIAKIFEEHVRKSVPFYEEIHRMIAEISDWFLGESSLIYDLGTSTGEAILQIHGRHGNKKLRYIAVDAASAMIDKARIRLLHVPNVQFLACDLNNPFLIENASMVLLVLTLQFLKPESRPRLLKEVYDGLGDGGALVLVEKVSGKSARFDEMWVALHHDMKRRSGFSDSEISDKDRSLRGVMLPYSLHDDLQLLRGAGFRKFDVFFKWYDWAGILAIK